MSKPEEQTKSANNLESTKLLIEMSKPEHEISGVSKLFFSARKRLEAALTVVRENDKKRGEAKRQEQARIAMEEERVKAAEEETVRANAKPVAPLASAQEAVSPPVKQEKPDSASAPETVSAPTAAPQIQEPAKARVYEPPAAPSYIKGVYTPPVRPVSASPSSVPRTRTFDVSGGARPQGGPRAGGGYAPRNPAPLRPGQGPALSVPPPGSSSGRKDKKKEYNPAARNDDKKTMNKRTLIRRGYLPENMDEDRTGVRKLKNKRRVEIFAPAPIKIERALITTENLTVKILSEKIGKTAQEIIKQLLLLGIPTTINSVVDFPTMELVASELGIELELRLEKTQEAILVEGHDEIDEDKDLIKRPPVITVMGHVDHGKTSLLDRIRKTSVVTGEAGGITQAIGAYTVTVRGESITFLDTPGHEAFTEMRARGAQVTDIAILVVAADDGIMPQTIEAINHARAASVPVIVAINKIDKPGANIEKITQMLTEHGLVSEAWGGDTIIVPLSAKTGENVDKLLESVLLLAEVNNYRANPSRLARGTVIEARLDKGRGPVANVIVQNGTLRVGDTVVSGTVVGRVRAMTDDKGRALKEAGPSVPVSILGFAEVPGAGDAVLAVADEKAARAVAAERVAKFRVEQTETGQKVTLDDILQVTGETKLKELNLLIKADVQGSAEALKNSLEKLCNEEAKVRIIHAGVGAVTKSDIMLAEVSKAIIIGFNVRPDAETKTVAEQAGIDIRSYRIIYEAIEDITAILSGMITPKYRETVTGRAEVRNVFKITGSGIVAGSYVVSGKIYRNSRVRVLRGEEIVFEGGLRGLKRFKEDVKEVAEGYECGISVDGFSDIKDLDMIEAYSLERI